MPSGPMVAPMKRPREAILSARLVLLPCTLLSCGDDQIAPAGETPPPPATSGSATTAPTSDDTTGAGALSCNADDPCAADQACAADYALGDPPPPADAFTCRPGCIAPGELLLWCLDDAACCDGTLCLHGLCDTPPTTTADGTGSDSDGSSSGSGGSTSDTGSTGTTDSGSTSDASSSSGSTDSGSGTGTGTGTGTGSGTSSTSGV